MAPCVSDSLEGGAGPSLSTALRRASQRRTRQRPAASKHRRPRLGGGDEEGAGAARARERADARGEVAVAGAVVAGRVLADAAQAHHDVPPGDELGLQAPEPRGGQRRRLVAQVELGDALRHVGSRPSVRTSARRRRSSSGAKTSPPKRTPS